MTGRQSKKNHILDAAARTVERDGAAHLTIDAVALESGVSKGGVLYHFPSKRALLDGMLNRLIESVRDRADKHEARMTGESGPAVRAWIQSENEQERRERAMSMAILAAAAEAPDLVAPARSELSRVFKRAADTPDPDLAVILLLATEGLRFLDLLNLLPMTKKERKRLCGVMLDLGKGERA